MTTPLSGMVCDLYSTTILSIIPVQFTCLTIFLHNLSPSLLWSTSWSGALHLILHTFLYPISVFFFATHAHTIAACFAVVQRSYHLFLISLSQLFTWDFYLNITHPSDHSHLCSLHLVGHPCLGWLQSNLTKIFGTRKLVPGLLISTVSVILCLAHQLVTDTQSDKHRSTAYTA